MGYFSNGSEGCDYENKYCDHCVHKNGPDGKSGCAVWLAHMLRNYDECNNENSILHILIPRKGIENEKCTMFLLKESESAAFKKAELELAKYKEAMLRHKPI